MNLKLKGDVMGELDQMSKDLRDLNQKMQDMVNAFMKEYPHVKITRIDMTDASTYCHNGAILEIRAEVR